VTLALTRGRPYAFPRPEAAKELLPTQATVAFDAAEVVLELRGLRADGRYRVGLSWWDYGGKGRSQSVAAASPDGKGQQQVVAPTRLPKWVGEGKLPAEVVFELPPALCRSGAVRLHVRKERGANAVLGEAWVWRSQ